MTQNQASALAAAFTAPDSSTRLQAALDAGSRPDDAFVAVLLAQCAVEPDFFVRDMLTWALVRHDPSVTFDLLLSELRRPEPQARSQALHTLSKIGDPRAYPEITASLLLDEDDEVARAAWRAAAGLVPASADAATLAETLATQFARGDVEVRRSLSRAFVELGDAAAPAIARARRDADPEVRAHAIATARLREDPEAGFTDLIAEAQRAVALDPAPRQGG